MIRYFLPILGIKLFQHLECSYFFFFFFLSCSNIRPTCFSTQHEQLGNGLFYTRCFALTGEWNCNMAVNSILKEISGITIMFQQCFYVTNHEYFGNPKCANDWCVFRVTHKRSPQGYFLSGLLLLGAFAPGLSWYLSTPFCWSLSRLLPWIFVRETGRIIYAIVNSSREAKWLTRSETVTRFLNSKFRQCFNPRL